MRLLAIFMLVAVLATACSSSQDSTSADLPAGDAARGAALFSQSVNGAPACSTCHTLDETTLVGPGMQGYGERAGSRIEGQSAEEYTYNSITQPAAHIVSGFSNTMYTQYGRQLSPQQTADLIAYLLTL
jgi:mono/diheme cytochrome c family protein